jgi:hypothetical protein
MRRYSSIHRKEHTMHTPHQIWRQVTPKAQLLIALALATVLAFSTGLASGLYGRTLYTFLTMNRAGTAPAAAPVTASNQAAPLGIDLPYGADIRELPQGLSDYIRRGNTSAVVGMHSYPLGIELPHGADIHDLPRGLTDYLRPGSTTSIIGMQSHPLGIDLPQGVDIRTLPRGLTDYLRPQTEKPSVAASSTVLGITMPTGAQRSDLPRGVTDYLRSGR